MLGELPSCWRGAEERRERAGGTEAGNQERAGGEQEMGRGRRVGTRWAVCGESESAGGTEGTGGAVNRTYPGRCHQRTGQSEESIWL